MTVLPSSLYNNDTKCSVLGSASTTFKCKSAPASSRCTVSWITGLCQGHWAPDQGLLARNSIALSSRGATAEVSPCEGTSAVTRSPLVCLFGKLSRSSSLSPMRALLTLPHLGNLSRSTSQRAASSADVGPPISSMKGTTTLIKLNRLLESCHWGEGMSLWKWCLKMPCWVLVYCPTTGLKISDGCLWSWDKS